VAGGLKGRCWTLRLVPGTPVAWRDTKETRMATIVVFGGTGYTGGNIVREAASRGHHVIAVSRTEPAEPIEGVTYETGAVEALAPA